MTSLLTSALNYLKSGLSTIPTNSQKQSLYSWKKYQAVLPTEDELKKAFSTSAAKGIAVICGAVSGNLEVIDVDCKYGVNFEDYAKSIKDANTDLYSRLLIIKTKSNGYHIYYRCEVIEGNQKLAERPANDDELHENPNAKQFVLIETRGEAGYVIAPPTDGYDHVQGSSIPVITIDERDTLLSIARSFTKIIEPIRQPRLPNNNDTITTWDDYNKRGDVIALLEKHGWSVTKRDGERSLLLRPGASTQQHSAVFFHNTRIFYVHTTSTNFENKGYNPFAVYTHLECNGDWRKAAKQLSEIYGERNEGGWFWTYSRNGSVVINKYELLQWLYDNYVQLYFHDKKTGAYRLVHEEDRKICEIWAENIKKYVKDRLVQAKQFDVLEAIIKHTNSIFSDSFFEYIDASNAEILRDDKDTCYFPFNNTIVTISKNEIKTIPYSNITKSIWESQINSYDITIINDFVPQMSKYYQFISKISADDQERINYAMTLIGYILHSYKDPSKPYAPILAEETDDEAKGGGTGKGIFFQAISKLIPVVRIDGKNFRPDKTFAFQRVTLGTKLVVIEDCPKNVDFERYYPTITEGMTIEKKNQDEMFLKFEESPKIAFTTNYTINNTAEHAKRRQRVLEFAPFFSSKFTPLDYFGERMFDDWDNDEMQKFYNFLFYCVKMYMNQGVMAVDNSDKLRRKQVKMQFGEEMLDFLDDCDSGVWRVTSEEWKAFLLRNEFDKKEYSLKRFAKGIKIGSQILDYDYEEQKNRQNNNVKEYKIVRKVKNVGDFSPIVTDLHYF
jgi:hypothetical protein